MRVHHRLSLFLLLIVSMFSSVATAGTYMLVPEAKNRVEFHSKATLESFAGKAKSVAAMFEIDTTNLFKSTGQVTVDLRSLDTGIGLRNKHMCENHLHTDSFPNAVFQLDSVSGVGESLPTPARVHGRMTIHGVTRSVSASCTISRVASKSPGALRLQTEFPLKITEYGIARPEFLFLKLAEEVSILVDLTIFPNSP